MERIKNQSTIVRENTVPCQHTRNEMQSLLLKREKDNRFYTHEQVKEEMKNFIASL